MVTPATCSNKYDLLGVTPLQVKAYCESNGLRVTPRLVADAFGLPYGKVWTYLKRGASYVSKEAFLNDVEAIKAKGKEDRIKKSKFVRLAIEWGYKRHYITNWKRLGARLDSKEIFDSDVARLRVDRRQSGYAVAAQKNKERCASECIAKWGSRENYLRHRWGRQRELMKSNPLRYEKYLAKARERYRMDGDNKRLLNAMRRRVHKVVTTAHAFKAGRTFEMIGCSGEFLRSHLERQFAAGMSWDNYGTDWHVDHIIPCSHFDMTKPEHQRICFNWQNLRPLWASDNCRRQNKLEKPTQISLAIAV